MLLGAGGLRMSSALLCDVGNTANKICFLEDNERRLTIALPSAMQTPDSLGLMMQQACQRAGLADQQFAVCLAASVAPSQDAVLKRAVRTYFGCETFFLGRDFDIPLKIDYAPASALGADRLAAAYAARLAFPESRSIIVVDLGTAVTFDCVTDDTYGGGLIFPGPESALTGLRARAPHLPWIAFEGHVSGGAGHTTADCLKNGLALGYASLVRGICSRLAADLPGPVSTVASGGYANHVNALCQCFDSVTPNLVLEGLAALFFKNAVNYQRS